jgi:excinuclease ABC subunit C
MKNDRIVTDVFDLAAGRYPHIKMTVEEFPRLLATRRIDDDDADYFGAFLSKTAVRILIDFLNKTFRLRTCDIEIDGNFAVPCTQYYRRRCVAPCVSTLCSRDRYLDLAEAARLFLANDRGGFRFHLSSHIDALASELDFETAAFFRDILTAVERFWKQSRWQVWLDDAIDTYVVDDTPDGWNIYLVTHRGRSVLGRKVFTVDRNEAESVDIALAEIIDNFYAFHLPKEIRVNRDFADRKRVTEKLSARFQKKAVIRVSRPEKTINAARGLILSHAEQEIDEMKPTANPERIAGELTKTFGLAKPPNRIEAFDVAHISGTGFVSASAVWQNGSFLSADYQFLISAEKSELATLADGVRRHLIDRKRPRPDLVLLDGGKPQLNAVLKLAETVELPPVVAAVKPRGKHSLIASFLTTDTTIEFDPNSAAHSMLQLLRDEAHDLANRVHRDYREMMPFYELVGENEPLIVPLRFHAENGGAEDLIPIETR